MQRQFESNILKNQLFNKQQRLLLAISGGVDSVVLAHLLKAGKYNFAFAHCNFKLRGKDSDKDEQFCEKLAEKFGAEFYIKSFDTKKFASKNKLSIQMAARDLRYDWFKQLAGEKKFEYILTAHHANDVTETVLINLLRGTGINGLKGINARSGNIVRPLLPFSKEEITSFAKKNKLVFRVDKSNEDDKYERNFIRLHVIPNLKKINPKPEATFLENSFRLSQEAGIVRDYLNQKATELVIEKKKVIYINKKKLKNEPYLETVLNFILKPYGFSSTQQKNIASNLINNSVSGKIFCSKTHILTIDRDELLICVRGSDKSVSCEVNSLGELSKSGFEISQHETFSIPEKHELLIVEKQLIFPLTIRQKQTGDKFKPFGMKGFKLISDFLKDEKLNAVEKEKCRLLVNGNNEIIWVIGHRSDERYRVAKNETRFLKITTSEKYGNHI